MPKSALAQSPAILDLGQPEVSRVMHDFATQQRWEVLRRTMRPCSALELAAACDGPLDSVQESLDLLVAGGFATRHKATSANRHVTYAAKQAVVVVWTRESRDQCELARGEQVRQRLRSREVIDRIPNRPPTQGFPKLRFEATRSPLLTQEEAREVTALLNRAVHLMNDCTARALRRRGTHMTIDPTPGGSPGPSIPYHCSVVLAAVHENELPFPQVDFNERLDSFPAAAARLAKTTLANPASQLSDREQEVAHLLANGKSRPEVARSLGISVNTVASSTKRIYSKLGVRNRAEFAASLRGTPIIRPIPSLS
jgi:DNA-binding CsgD family transcriptional regulator